MDHHDDLECGGYFHDYTKPFISLDERKAFTYSCLGIADFIVPAFYEGVFDTFYNMKGLVTSPFQKQEKYVKLVGKNTLITGEYIPFLHAGYKKNGSDVYRFYTSMTGSLGETPFLEQVVLDIDLDYFCWDDSLSTAAPKRLEITKEAYEECQKDPYHPFRILPRRLLRTEEYEGRYYIRYEEPADVEKRADEERIRKRIRRFIDWLGSLSWEPSLITICRSVHSGYLPGDCAELVEQEVCRGLEELWGV